MGRAAYDRPMSEEQRLTVSHLAEGLGEIGRLVEQLMRNGMGSGPNGLLELARALERLNLFLGRENLDAPTPTAARLAEVLAPALGDLKRAVEEANATDLTPTQRSRKVRALREVGAGVENAAQALWRDELDGLGSASRQDLAAVQGMVSATRRQLDEASARISELRNSSEEQYLKLSEHSAALEGTIESRRQTVEQLVADMNDRFAHEQKARAEEARLQAHEAAKRRDDALSEFERSADARLVELDRAFDGKREALDEESAQILTSLREQETTARELVDLVATSSTAGAYGNEAGEQRSVADRLRRLALVTFGGAVVLAMLITAWALRYGLDPWLLAAKAGLIVLMVSVAGYLSRQSSHHREREVQARRLYLQLTAFGPFAAPLGEDRGRGARVDFMERVFVGEAEAKGNGNGGNGKPTGLDDPAMLRQVIDLLLEARR